MKKASSIFLIIVTLLTCINLIDFPWQLRFVDFRYNYLFVSLLAVSLPVAVFLWFTVRKAQLIGVVFALCLVIPCYFMVTFAYLSYTDIKKNNGVDYAFEEVDRLIFGSKSYVLYRTNGGATTSYGLVLRLEKEMVSGINAVNVLYSNYKASEGSLEPIGDDQIKLQIQPYEKYGKVETVVLSI